MTAKPLVDELIERVNRTLLEAGLESKSEEELERDAVALRKRVAEATRVFSVSSLFNGEKN